MSEKGIRSGVSVKIRVFQKNGKVYMELPAELPLSDVLLKKGSVIIKPVVPGAYLLLEKHSLAGYLMQPNSQPAAQPASGPQPGQAQPQPRQIVQKAEPDRAQAVSQPASQPRASGTSYSYAYNVLKRNGYAIISNQNDAIQVSKDSSDDIKAGRILGTRGFDGKYYICTSFFYKANAAKAKQALKNGPLALDKISQQAKLDQVATQAVVNLLLDNGELIETKKGEYALA